MFAAENEVTAKVASTTSRRPSPVRHTTTQQTTSGAEVASTP
jgi:hypothetical protein